jgi:tetratricopeptide (TPR) repeat protein
MLIPTLESHRFEAFICGGWLSKKWKKTKKFVAAHKKEILIGAAVIVGAAIVVAAVTYGVGAAAASAAAGAANSNDHNKTAVKTSDVTTQAETIKDMVLSKELVSLDNPHFPIADNARILAQACAQAAFEKLQNSVSCNTYFSSDLEKMGGLKPETYHLIDQAFSKPIPWYSWDYANSFKENVYAARGAYAADIKLYDQAYSDFDKALKLNPNNSDVYLNRALTYFETGQIDKAAADFQKHVSLRSEPIKDMKDFSLGFARGLGRGVKDSGVGLYEFAGDLAFHPISTATKMYESGKMLFELTKSAQWQEIAQVLSPEAYELATNWEILSFEKRGELSGYVFGKHGADILIPGASIKLVKGAIGEFKILANVVNAGYKAEKALVLESSALGTGKIADASFGIKTATGLKDLGEVGFLKHVEHLNKNQMVKFSNTALEHMREPGRWVPMHLMQEIIEHPIAKVSDPRGALNADMYYSQITRNGKLYNIEILYDSLENKISHFKYTDRSIGPLKKIDKHEF